MKRRDFIIASATFVGSAVPALVRGQNIPCPPFTLSVAGGQTVSTACGPSSAAAPAWLVGMAVGEWKLVSNSSLSGVSGVSSVPGNTGRASIVTAWNGTCVDPRNSMVYLLGCGGHGDYAGNEVYSINLEVDSPTWTLRRNATTSVSNGDYYGDGRPSSTHTYHTQVFVPEINRGMRFGSGAHYSNAYSNSWIDRFDPDTNDWDAYTGPSKSLAFGSQAATTDQSWAAVRDPNTGNCYIFHNHQNTAYRINRWTAGNPGSITTIISSVGRSSYEMCAAYDSSRDIALFASGEGAVRLDVGAGTSANFLITNGGPSSANGMIYVPATDRYYYRNASAGGTVRAINPSTWASSAFSTTGGGSIPSRQNGCYNAFGYCPRLGGAYYVASYTGGVWFLKIHEVA